ncbi:MAG: tetratricopeptide repeat protein [Phycisphaerales bacterium]
MRALPLFLASVTIASLASCGPRPVEVARKDADFNYDYGRYEIAAPSYLEIIDRYPGDWEAEYRYGMCLVYMGNAKEARTHIETAAAANPESREVAFALADVYAKLNERGRMVEILVARANSRGETESWIKLAELAHQLNDLDLENMAIANALRMRSDGQWQAYVYDAQRAEKHGEKDLAIRRLRQAYFVNPYSPVVITMLQERGEETGPTTGLPPEQ